MPTDNAPSPAINFSLATAKKKWRRTSHRYPQLMGPPPAYHNHRVWASFANPDVQTIFRESPNIKVDKRVPHL